MSVAISAPFRLQGGSIAHTHLLSDQVENKILNVLVTNKYERPMLAQYGAGVQQLLFDSVEDLELSDWKIDAAAAISKAVSGVQIIDITVQVTDDTEATITVYYRTPLASARALTFTLPINEVLTEETPI